MPILSYSGGRGRGHGRGDRQDRSDSGRGGRGRGRNFPPGPSKTKWVRSKQPKNTETQNTESQTKEGEEKKAPQKQINLKRQGSNKLVNSITTTQSFNARRQPVSTRILKRPPPQPPIRATKRPRHTVAKRITLHHESRSTTREGYVDDNKEETNEKLTDFAYRTTSTVVQRKNRGSKSMQWSLSTSGKASKASSEQQARGSRNMGLVRVPPNAKKTPICSTFLRGVQCTDRYCRKRHDIPKEYALPVCLYFQRHGQCLKGDECVFRHVKVNPRATICPSFAVLGFCEDPSCTMKHISTQRPSSKSKIKISK